MSILIEYTEEDLLALNSMVDALNNNVNHLPINGIDSNNIYRLCQPTEIIGVPIAYSIHKFIRFLSPGMLTGAHTGGYIEMKYLVYYESLEKVPLYINIPNNLGLVAKWRLQIGK
jgi:hypothetical protein